MILLLLAFFIVDLLSIACPFVAYYLWREWDRYNNTIHDDYADRCLYGAIAMLIFILFGRIVIRFLLSKSRKAEDEPHFFEGNNRNFVERTDGSKIYYEIHGKPDGQPIVFVHGWNANIRNWYYQKKFFEKKYKLIMMDLAGLGRSTRPRNKDFSLQKMASDLNAVITHSGVVNPILWGHSIGGMTILTLLTKSRTFLKAKLKGVVLQHTTYTNPVKTIMFHKFMTAIQKPVLEPLCWLIIFLSPLIWLMRWMSYLNGNSLIVSRWLTFAGTQTRKQLDFTTLLSTMAPPSVMARGVLGMFRYDVKNLLGSIKEPVLIIAADKDRLTRPFASDYMKKNIQGAQVVTLSPGNHQGLVERHEETNRAVESFITSCQ